jgi:hypothetical protein
LFHKENFPITKFFLWRELKMALFILNPGIQPLGDFDLLDLDAASILGGEVMTLDKASRLDTAIETSAADVKDGYVCPGPSEGDSAAYRVVARIADTSTETYKLFYLSDDGKAHYGVTFGTVIGGVGGKTTGTNLGPSTVTGSGKVTLWDKSGLYAVSTDALAADVIPASLDTPLPGEVLYRGETSGRLTRASTTTDKIAAFIELTSNGSLVTTPSRLVGGAETFDRIKIYYYGAEKMA